MIDLTKREEQILLAILELKNDACLVSVKKYLADVLGINWTIGAIHKPLLILENNGFIESFVGEATAKRGGRSKKIYLVTNKGMEALKEQKKVNETLWASFPGILF